MVRPTVGSVQWLTFCAQEVGPYQTPKRIKIGKAGDGTSALAAPIKPSEPKILGGSWFPKRTRFFLCSCFKEFRLSVGSQLGTCDPPFSIILMEKKWPKVPDTSDALRSSGPHGRTLGHETWGVASRQSTSGAPWHVIGPVFPQTR